jgi:hypothetical protein
MISCDSRRWSYHVTWFPVAVDTCLANLCTGWWGHSSGCCVLRLWQNSTCWVLGESCTKQGTDELLGLISSNFLGANLYVPMNVYHFQGWFDTIFYLSQEVVIFWIAANQCKFYKRTQARIGHIWGKCHYGYSGMSLYRNGNVFTARFLVTGNCCILFDPGQLSKHDQGVPCSKIWWSKGQFATLGHIARSTMIWREHFAHQVDRHVWCESVDLSYFRYLSIISCRAGVDCGISRSPSIRRWIDLRNHQH